MSTHSTDWQRRFDLFDAVADLPRTAREAWFLALQTHEPQHVEAVRAMLKDGAGGVVINVASTAAARARREGANPPKERLKVLTGTPQNARGRRARRR